jgi:hypothetical protein
VQDEGAFILTCAHHITSVSSLSLHCVLRMGSQYPTLRVQCSLNRTMTVTDAAIFFAFSRTAFKGLSVPRWTKAPSGIGINAHYFRLRFGGLKSRLHGLSASSHVSSDVTIATSIVQPVSCSHDTVAPGSQRCVLLADMNTIPPALHSMHGCPIITREGYILGILLGPTDANVARQQLVILPIASLAALIEDSRSWNATTELMSLCRLFSAIMADENTTPLIR